MYTDWLNLFQAEKQRSALSSELDDLSGRLDEAGGATAAQVDLNKKRENEIAKLRRDLDEQQVNGEANISAMKKKMNDLQAELSDNVDNLNKAKTK